MKTFYTQGGWAGEKYDTNLSTKTIAKIVRAEIKKKYPKYKFSVTFKSFSGGSSIDIRVMRVDYNPLNPAYNGTGQPTFEPRYVPEYIALEKDLKSMLDQYRYNDSDGQIDYFDTNFYGHVQLSWEFVNELKGIKLCPACGYRELDKNEAANSLSRYREAYICNPCGTREAFEGDFWAPKQKVA